MLVGLILRDLLEGGGVERVVGKMMGSVSVVRKSGVGVCGVSVGWVWSF